MEQTTDLEISEQVTGYVQEDRTYEVYQEKKPSSLFVRFIITNRHLMGLAVGGGFAFLRHRREIRAKRKLRFTLLKLVLLLYWPFVNKKLIKQPFSVQLRRRLEMLGATYIKLGQILSLREDILPESITDELKKLLDTLPALPYERYAEIVEDNLGMPLHRAFSQLEEKPLGSASIAQAHRGILRTGETVVIKLLKPGTRELIKTDSKIITFMGGVLEIFAPQLQPKNMFTEFCDYTNKEVDFRLEADNAELFASNFVKYPDVVFPKIFRQYSNENMLVMEYLKGMKPDANAAKVLTQEEKEKVVDLGAFSIIKMLYHDGFFHADLHPGNLIILEGGRCAFIDLGMVGRFEENTRKNMLYYYNSLIMGEADSAARYMLNLAKPGKGGDPEGFRKEFVQMANRWIKNPNFNDFSLGQLIFESTFIGAKHHMYYPLEMVLMVKAIVTFEGVGNVILPGIDIQKISKKHIRKLVLEEVNPVEFLKNTLQNAPEMLDIITRLPMLMMELLKRTENNLYEKQNVRTPMEGLQNVVFGGFCILSGCILAATGNVPWPVYAALFAVGAISALRK